MVLGARPAAGFLAVAGLLAVAAVIAFFLLLNPGVGGARTHDTAAARPGRTAYPLLSIVRARDGQFYIRTFAGMTNTKRPTYFVTGPGRLLMPITTGRGDGYVRVLHPKGRWIHIEVTCVGGGLLAVLHDKLEVFAVKPCNGTGTWQDTYPSSVLRGHGRWRIEVRPRTTWVIAGIADSRQ